MTWPRPPEESKVAAADSLFTPASVLPTPGKAWSGGDSLSPEGGEYVKGYPDSNCKAQAYEQLGLKTERNIPCFRHYLPIMNRAGNPEAATHFTIKTLNPFWMRA